MPERNRLALSLYNVLFGWWLDGWTSKGGWRRLKREIETDCGWLFEHHGAVVLPYKPYRQVLDYANVAVAAGNLLFIFTRGMGEFHVTVAPAHAPHDWYELKEAIELARGSPAKSSKDYEVSDFRQMFEPNI